MKERWGLWVSDAAVDLPLHALGLSDQPPCYRAFGRDPAKIKPFVEIELKDIQKTCTWSLRGQPPEIKACDEKDGDPVLSRVMAEGEWMFDVKTEKLVSSVDIDFLKKVIRHRTRPLIFIADHASYPTSNPMNRFGMKSSIPN